VLNSNFAEGIPVENGCSESTNEDDKSLSGRRRIVEIPDDYDLFRVILFWLYTDKIFFTNNVEGEDSKVLSTNDAEGIYAIAHRFTIDDITSNALHFLKSTCSIHNITARSFGRFALTYESVGEAYDQYLMDHWDEVVHTDEWEEFFTKADAEDCEEFSRINSKLREMIRNRTSKE